MRISRQLQIAVGLLFAVIATGTAWYAMVEDFGFLDGLFMAVTSLTTVGYREVQPLDTSGRVFTIAFLLVGIGVMFYTVVSLAEAVIAGEIAEALGVQRLSRRLTRMRDHYVICGFGRVGQEIVRELRERDARIVVIDKDPAKREPATKVGCIAIVGDATEEEVLRQAGVERAHVLIAAADSDVGNTFTTLTARALNPGLVIIARAGSEPAEQRLRTAGANRTISPHRMAGRRMALAAVQPLVLDFAETARVARSESDNLLAELVVPEGGDSLAGRTLADVCAGLRATRVLAIERPDGEVLVGPPETTELRAGDRLMLFGEEHEIESLPLPQHVRQRDGGTQAAAASS